jgi:predicted RecB family nuclease
LVDLKGLGAAHYNELRRLGITRVEELAVQDPEALVTQWRSVAGEKPPTLAQVKAWVRAARARMRAFGSSPLRSGVREFD